MKTVLCFGDSNTWGYIPITGRRRPYSERWPGAMAGLLGNGFIVSENAVGGRTTSFDDPICPKRCGAESLDEALIANHPLDLVIIMLGTNDSKIHLHQTPYSIASGMELLVKAVISKPEYGPGYGADGKAPKILIAAPPLINEDIITRPGMRDFDISSAKTVQALAPLYNQIAEKYGCGFLNAACCAEASYEDCLHITADSHKKLAAAMAEKVRELLD